MDFVTGEGEYMPMTVLDGGQDAKLIGGSQMGLYSYKIY
jgi:hypothetical protein